MTEYAPIPFADHLKALKFKQGEHIFISGSTGSGKTTIARFVLERRSHVLAFSIKNRDSTLTTDYKDWSVVDNLNEVEPWMNRVLLWPRTKHGGGDEFLMHQREVLHDAFNQLLKANGWCLFIDELNYLSSPMHGGLSKQIEALQYIGRSSGISIVSAAQRPAYVPAACLTNSSHAYIGRTRFNSDLKRLADFGDIDPTATKQAIVSLPSKHDFLYLPTQGDGTPGIVNSRK